MGSLRVFASTVLVLATSVVLAHGPAAEKPSGLERRLPWEDSSVVGSPDPLLPYKMVRAFPKVTVKSPLVLAPEPGTDRLFVLEHMNFWAGPGRIVAFADDQDASETVTLLDNIDGLAVGMVFHPDYQKNGYLFLGLNGPMRGRPKTTQVVRYTVDPKMPNRIDPATKKLIIEWPSNGHDGGDVAFGNDGYLYATAGDGSSDSDANLTGQKISDIPGSVIRIDVDHPDGGKNYSVPRDNPFVDRPGARPELWAYGLRNPWRMSFDRESGQLWVGNNGQDLWEQAYLIKKGGNYGWSISEGSHSFRVQREPGPDPILPPTAEHAHSEARSLTGGRVYRGHIADLVGAYIYGDWSTGKIWGIKVVGDKVAWHKELVDTPFSLTGFGTDHSGEMYVIDEVTGFYRFEPTTEADKIPGEFPTRLSRTGVFASVAPLKPNPAAIPFDVIAPQWADGAKMEHLAAIPGLERIEQKSQRNAGGAWTFPNGSVLAQTLSLDVLDGSGKPTPRKVETRLLTRQQGEWVGYSYRWNEDQTDAELVGSSGDSEEFEVADPAAPGGRREQIWRFPARAECLSCHSRAMGFTLGFTPSQLDRDHDYGGKVANQLDTFDHIGLFEGPLPERSAGKPSLVDPADEKASLEARVRSYLSVNCSICHVKEGGGNALIELSLDKSKRGMHAIGEPPVHSKFGIEDAQVIAPGAPERSILHYRISRRGADQMPPLVSTEVDRQAVKMIGEWIRGLPKAEK
ncbi:PQQ-dependent sugar dehydrogenase [Tundrisphaera lichenicola]|uniref:PQQ-dependent sugar dehydrogenase n=1 Tax=Tundrisphaera lichenicola TaxID=2029860 RepID=UPI003EB796EF